MKNLTSRDMGVLLRDRLVGSAQHGAVESKSLSGPRVGVPLLLLDAKGQECLSLIVK